MVLRWSDDLTEPGSEARRVRGIALVRHGEPLPAGFEHEGRETAGANLSHEPLRARDVLIDLNLVAPRFESGAVETDIFSYLSQDGRLDNLESALVMRVLDAAQHREALAGHVLGRQHGGRSRP
jgi:hypothetical protein